MPETDAVRIARMAQLMSWLKHGEGLVPPCICRKCQGTERKSHGSHT